MTDFLRLAASLTEASRGRAAAVGNEAAVRHLIVTADDFGLALPVNEAIERGHRDGILSTASLMVAAPETADAVERARKLPSLRVGLHIVVVNGRPILPPARVPHLIDKDGNFASNLFSAGVRYFFTPRIRGELEAEIRAQFAAFAATGLHLDHVNAQNHFHVHPTVLSLIMKIGREYGLRAVRIPHEPFWSSWLAMRSGAAARLLNAAFLAPWLMLMRRRLRRAGIVSNDYIFGMHDTGHMTAERVYALLQHLPQGTSELYVHPATHVWPQAFPPNYDFAGEFRALIDPAVCRAVRESSIRPVTFTQMAAARAR
jgi:chitin disaccharide deacetylase